MAGLKKEDDALFMAEAIKEARKALKRDEVPVGAVLVTGGGVVSRGFNAKECSNDPTAHAEIIALRRAARKLKTWRLTDATIYVTLEPCAMCMGAIVQARVKRLVFASFDPKAGACGSVFDIGRDGRLNHRVIATSGTGEAESAEILKIFFSSLRGRLKKKRSGDEASRG